MDRPLIFPDDRSDAFRSNYKRTDTLDCQSQGCFGDPQETALDALVSRQIQTFIDAITDEKFNPNHIYDSQKEDPDFLNKNLLEIAVDLASKNDEFVRSLLPIIPLDRVNDLTEIAPIHSVTQKGDYIFMEMVLNSGVNFDVNVQDGEGSTPLHHILMSMTEAEDSKKDDFVKCLNMFLKFENVEPNAEDLKGNLTPLYYAACSNHLPAVETLLKHGSNPNTICDGIKISDLIKETFPNFNLNIYFTNLKARPFKSLIFEYIETDDLNGLKRLFASSKEDPDIWNHDNGSLTPIQCAALCGFDRIVDFLLSTIKVNPNLSTSGEPRSPVLIAAHHGYYKVLKVLKKDPRTDFTIVEPISGKTVLHEVFRQDSAKYIYRESSFRPKGSDYKRCFQVLLDTESSARNFKNQIDAIINYAENLDGDTPLHYATMQTDQELIRMFLKRGANMGIKNKKERTPVQCILPDTLQTFLDEDCVSWDGIITDEKFKLTFLYDFLAPPLLNNDDEIIDKEKLSHDTKRALPETEPLWYMSMASKEHRMLLKHPVIASFLWLKWQRIRSYFYINLFLYTIFVALLTTFIFLRYGGIIEISDNVAILTTLKAVLSGLLLILLFREVFQMGVSLKRYFFSVENFVELGIIGLSYAIMFDEHPEAFNRNRHLSALILILTWTEVLVLVGRHPRLSTNIVMFRTVTATFLGFLLWYSIIIIAFGLAFYIMMYQDGTEENPGNPFFNSVSSALFKTSTMFVGELEFGEIPFTDNLLNPLLFLAFVFLIVVVLMNLLNGLAVSDTGLIREEAEVLGWLSRVELITYTESMLLGDPFLFLSNWPAMKLLRKIPHCGLCQILYKLPAFKSLLQKITGGTKILLFYTCLPTKKASFFPNKRGKSLFGYKRSLKIDDIEQPAVAPNLYVSTDVLESAKSLIIQKLRKREEEESHKGEIRKLEKRMQNIENILVKLYNKK